MVQSCGIEAFVRRRADGRKYWEYDVPRDSPKYTGKRNEVYIEAVTGEAFEVVMRPTQDFDFKGCEGIDISCVIDNGTAVEHFMSAKTMIKSFKDNNVAGREITFGADAQRRNGKWMKAQVVFSQLALDESAEPDQDEVSKDLDERGRITFVIRRGSQKGADNPQPWPDEEDTDLQTASKEVMKNGHVSHTVSHLLQEEIVAPVGDWEFVRATGRAGAPIKLTIRYRSRTCLQLLKIVPPDEDEKYAVQGDLATSETGDKTAPDTATTTEQRISAQLNNTAAAPVPVEHGRMSRNAETAIKTEKFEDEIDDEVEIISTRLLSRQEAGAQHQATSPASTPVKNEKPWHVSEQKVSVKRATSSPARNSTPTNSGTESSVLTDRERQKSRLQLSLEEMKIRREEIEFQRQVLELED